MDLIEQVRAALKPLSDKGLVHDVQMGAFASYGSGLRPYDPAVAVFMNVPDPESYQEEADRLVQAAGLRVELQLHRNPLAPRA
jgi:hypothetical protein